MVRNSIGLWLNKTQSSTDSMLFRILFIGLRLCLGYILIVASLPKVYQSYDFLYNVYEYKLLGPSLGLLSAMLVPWLEFVLGICLLTGIFLPGTFMLTAGLSLAFVLFQGSVLMRGLSINCGCFGGPLIVEQIGAHTFARTCVFAVAGLIGFVLVIFKSSIRS